MSIFYSNSIIIRILQSDVSEFHHGSVFASATFLLARRDLRSSLLFVHIAKGLVLTQQGAQTFVFRFTDTLRGDIHIGVGTKINLN